MKIHILNIIIIANFSSYYIGVNTSFLTEKSLGCIAGALFMKALIKRKVFLPSLKPVFPVYCC